MKQVNLHPLRIILAYTSCAFFLGLAASWLMFSNKELPKETICKDYITQNNVLSKQLEDLQVKFNLDKINLIKEVKLKEADLCLQRIEKYKAVCETLRCEICSRRK